MTIRVSHLGLCVSDLDRSLRFYRDGLGFETVATFDIGNEFGATLEVEGDVAMASHHVRRDGLTIELMAYTSPAPTGVPSNSRGQLGFTHLSFTVDDVDATAARLVDCGGSIVDATRTAFDGLGEFLFVADPDGTRVELMRLGGGAG